MNDMVQIIKEFLLPGSLQFFWICVAIGVALLYINKRTRRWGTTWLTLVLLFYWMLSTPLIALSLEDSLGRGYGWITSPVQAEGASAVVVLGGGSIAQRARGDEIGVLSKSSALRVLEGARLYRILDDPWIIVSGGISDRPGQITPESQALRDGLIQCGIPIDRIILEPQSKNTHDHPLTIAPILDKYDVDRFVLVTSPWHYLRVMATFRSYGMDPIPSSAVWHSEGMFESRNSLLPSDQALSVSKTSLREYMALGYYWLLGWLSPPADLN